MWTPLERHQASQQLKHRGWVSLLGAAKLLGVSYPTIQKMKREGKIQSTYMGTHRVDKNELLRVAEERGISSAALIGQSSSTVEIAGDSGDDSADFLVLDAWQEE